MTGISFVCAESKEDPHPQTFVAFRSTERETAIRDLLSVDGTEVWFTDFPELAEMASAQLSGPAQRLVIIGTAVRGAWTSWYPPTPAPPVPMMTAPSD